METSLPRVDGKPVPPRKDWPMTAHPTGQWSKKKAGKVYYFGAWDNWREALNDFNQRWPYIESGRPDPAIAERAAATPTTATFDAVCNLYLAERERDLKAGRMSGLHLESLKREIKTLLDFTPEGERQPMRHRLIETTKATTWAKFAAHLESEYKPSTRRRIIITARMVSKWASADGRQFCRPWEFGDALQNVSKGEIRSNKRDMEREHGENAFPVAQIPLILGALPSPLDAMFLLAINCGFGSSDCSALTKDVIDWQVGAIDFDRVKTGVQRYCYLWPETVKAIRGAIAGRPAVDREAEAKAIKAWEERKPATGKEALRIWQAERPDWDALAFLNPDGRPWVLVENSATGKLYRNDRLGQRFMYALERLDKDNHGVGKPLIGGLHFKRARIGFYTGRHTYLPAARRIDKDAAHYIMGHADPDMAAWYDHLDDSRKGKLLDVCEGLHKALMEGQTTEGIAARLRMRLVGTEPAPTTAAG